MPSCDDPDRHCCVFELRDLAFRYFADDAWYGHASTLARTAVLKPMEETAIDQRAVMRNAVPKPAPERAKHRAENYYNVHYPTKRLCDAHEMPAGVCSTRLAHYAR